MREFRFPPSRAREERCIHLRWVSREVDRSLVAWLAPSFSLHLVWVLKAHLPPSKERFLIAPPPTYWRKFASKRSVR